MIYTSYFYQIRFFDRHLIPLSTAVWDPVWFHHGRDQRVIYKDKNDVYIGMKYRPLVPKNDCCRGPEACVSKDPNTCEFLQEYRKQLDAMDFQQFLSDMLKICKIVEDQEQITGCIPVLIFHETPSKICSERTVVTKWLKDHDIDVKEFSKDVK